MPIGLRLSVDVVAMVADADVDSSGSPLSLIHYQAGLVSFTARAASTQSIASVIAAVKQLTTWTEQIAGMLHPPPAPPHGEQKIEIETKITGPTLKMTLNGRWGGEHLLDLSWSSATPDMVDLGARGAMTVTFADYVQDLALVTAWLADVQAHR